MGNNPSVIEFIRYLNAHLELFLSKNKMAGNQSIVGSVPTNPRSPPPPRQSTPPIKKYVGGTLGLFQRLGMPISSLKQGACYAFRLRTTDPEFLRVLRYIECSQEPSFGIQILTILKVATRAHDPPVEFKDDPKTKGMRRIMLWQGIPANNLQAILENGPQLPRRRNALNNYGIFFQDRAAASCYFTGDDGDDGGWSGEDKEGKQAYLLLSDVLVGESYTGRMTRNLRAPPSKEVTTGSFLWEETEVVQCQSVLTPGKFVPDVMGNVTLDEVLWPMGGTVEVGTGDFCEKYNHYTVFDTEQIRVKYLVHVEFTEKPYDH